MSASLSAHQAPVGTKDYLAPESTRLASLVASFADLASRYGHDLIVSPMFEDVGVFQRGFGEQSDVTRKEMYVFEDRGGRQLALRPEGTASVVRAYVQHRPTPPWRVWYVTPAFRYERPQAGRFRQHHQVGAEVLGSEDPTLDAELIALAWEFFHSLGLREVDLMINSMGDAKCRPGYVNALSDHLRTHAASLCDEHTEGWAANPLRVLDCKREPCIAVTDAGPKITDHLCEECAAHHAAVTSALEALGIPSVANPRLVRGFDYYTRTTFEFASGAIDAAQNALGGGGRYDALVEQLGGPSTPGIGFGSGLERLMLALEAEGAAPATRAVDVFVVDTTGGESGLVLAQSLRDAGLAVERALDSRSMKAQMKLADRSGARVAVLLGPKELDAGTVTLRALRDGATDAKQAEVRRESVLEELATYLHD